MRKFLLIFALILMLSAACFAFTACGDDTQSDPGDNSADSGTKPEPQPEPKPEPEKDEISFKTLEVNGTDVYGRVSKDKEIFEFTNEIKVSGNAKYIVALDALGMQTVATKTVSLNEGDNTFYVIETIDDDVTAVYTVVIHRTEVYEVSFVVEDVIAAETQYIEEGFFATEPTANVTTKLGYDFVGWDFDFTKPITGDVIVKAKIEQKEEMKIFEFTSTTTSCEITGLKDKTVTELVIPDYVTSIGFGVFSGCSSLESITIPFVGGSKSATSASSSTLFGYIFGTSSYTGGVATKQWYSSDSYDMYYIPSSLKSVRVTGGNILYSAFRNCSSLMSVTIPDSVTSIGYAAFSSCDRLTSVTIPDSVTSIGDYAFYNCTSLTSVTIGDSVTSIGDYAFEDCYKLVEVIDLSSLNITKGSYSNDYVGYYAIEVHKGESKIVNYNDYLFYTYDGVNYLLGYVGEDTTLVLPESYKGENYKIYNYAFYERDDITSVTIGNSVTSIGERAFFDCDSLTSVAIGNSVTSIGGYVFYNCTGLTSVTIPNSVTGIGEAAFYNCSNLTNVTIANSVKIIGDDAFHGCTSLTSVTIPDSVTSIGKAAFAYCDSLASVTIGNSVTSIGNDAFYGCEKLVEVINHSSLNITAGYLSNGYVGCYAIEVHKGESKIVNYNDYLFYTYNGVNYLLGYVGEDKALVLPKSYKGENYEIYNYAFYERNDITSVTIPNGITSIGSYAFSGCRSLTIYCEAASKPSGWASLWNYSNRPVVWGYKG